MTEDTPVELAKCHEHDIVLFDDGKSSGCIACDCEIDARPDHEIEQALNDAEFRNRISYSTAKELVPVMQAYLEDRDEGPIFVTHLSWNRELPAGYTEQERFVPFISYQFGSMVKHITTESSAKQTIKDLRDEGYSG